jgi:hypothetical protein
MTWYLLTHDIDLYTTFFSKHQFDIFLHIHGLLASFCIQPWYLLSMLKLLLATIYKSHHVDSFPSPIHAKYWSSHWIWEQVVRKISVWLAPYIVKFLDGSKMCSGRYCLHSIFFKRGTLKLLDGSNMYFWWWYLLSVFFKRGIPQRVQWNIMHWKQIAWEQLVLGRCRSRTERLESDDKPKQKLWQTLQRKPSKTSQTILDVSS